MPPDPEPKPHEPAREDDIERLRRYYREQFLPQNAWSTLLPRPYLYLRQRQRRLRDALLECGIDSSEKVRGLDVLDVGCGTGTNMAWLVELGADPARCAGIDLMSESVDAAKERLPGARWFVGDCTSTDVGGPFDLVVLIAVLTSVKDAALKRRIMDRCFALLRPGGVLFFYDYMTRKEDPGTANYKRLTYEEVDGYLGGRAMRWYKRDLLRSPLAERIVARHGVVAAELVQALGLFNIEGSFGYVRA
jgi:SAM-dependent methyltransferase